MTSNDATNEASNDATNEASNDSTNEASNDATNEAGSDATNEASNDATNEDDSPIDPINGPFICKFCKVIIVFITHDFFENLKSSTYYQKPRNFF